MGISGRSPTKQIAIKKEVDEYVTSLKVESRFFWMPKLMANSLIITADKYIPPIINKADIMVFIIIRVMEYGWSEKSEAPVKEQTVKMITNGNIYSFSIFFLVSNSDSILTHSIGGIKIIFLALLKNIFMLIIDN